jgi:pyridoxamine 5'-phosphate oxidase
MSLSDIRKSYELGHLVETTVSSDPFLQLQQWLNEAIEKQVEEPTAMTLCTVAKTAQGFRPSSRIVLLKDLNEQGPVWFTNYHSRKGKELAENPYAALQFHWVSLERQVRIEGKVEKVSASASDAYFQSRPVGSRIGAWASPQSETITQEQLMRLAQDYTARFQDNPPRPPHWGGYRLVPDYFEFWQGRPSRLHDRVVYKKTADDWAISRLAP